MKPNHAPEQTQPSRCSCRPRLARSGSLSLGCLEQIVMSHANVILGLVAAGICLGCSNKAKSSLNERFEIPKAGYPVTVEASGSEKVDALVCQLVSQRPAPYRSGYSEPPMAVVFSNRYCTPEVEAAIRALRELGPAVFPALVKHLHDKRYSYSDVCEAWLNHDVGDAVVEVLDDGNYMHSGYKSRETPSGGGGVYFSFDGYLKDRGAEAWAEWAKSRSRLDIQMDFIDWCIAKENERGYVDEAQKKHIIECYEDARQEMKDRYSKPDGAAKVNVPVVR